MQDIAKKLYSKRLKWESWNKTPIKFGFVNFHGSIAPVDSPNVKRPVEPRTSNRQCELFFQANRLN